jgi:undecaprenyl-phosphate galactose phosphotransferase/putative colanic acid biosynthesis UDP-glucose lipid carrier transferase
MQVNKLSDSMQATLVIERLKWEHLCAEPILMNCHSFNVFWGTMSVIGPRPHMLKHTEQYSELINNYLVRHYAKPGILGTGKRFPRGDQRAERNERPSGF